MATRYSVAYLHGQPGTTTLAIADSAGSVLVEYDLSLAADIPRLGEAVSPDGSRLAYCTGSEVYDIDSELSGWFDLALVVLDAWTGDVQLRIPLLREDYPSNFVDAARESRLLEATPRSQEPPPSPEDLATAHHYAFLEAPCTFDWAPGSRELAFSAILEGPSSDVYVVDVADGHVRRVTSEPGEVQHIDWSPDGRWIAYSARYPLSTNVVSREGDPATEYAGVGLFPLEWISSSLYLTSDYANTYGSWALTLLDATSGVARMIWPERWFDYAYIPGSPSLLLFYDGEMYVTEDQAAALPTLGIYSIDLQSGLATYSAPFRPSLGLEAWGDSSVAYVISTDSRGTFAVAPDGHVERLRPYGSSMTLSPDRRRLALYDWADSYSRRANLEVFTLEDHGYRELSREGVDWMAWSPDSCCILYSGLEGRENPQGELLYLVQIDTGRTTLIATDVAIHVEVTDLQAAWILQP